MNDTLLDLRQLVKYYPVTGGVFRHHVADVKAVDGVDLKITRGECLGLVGESGCGKTTLGKTILRLHDATSGRMYFDRPAAQVEDAERFLASSASPGRKMALRRELDVVKMKGRRLRALRQKLQIVFQDPSNSLSPRMLIRDIVAEPLLAQHLIRHRDVDGRVLELLEVVGMGKGHLKRYPHEFSGGQRQRIAIARALATNPEFILMDEPTSALDVSVQAQILNLLREMQSRLGLTYLFVAHDLGVVRHIADRVSVMYVGKLAEMASTNELYTHPLHPYTEALMSAVPRPDPRATKKRIVLEGEVADPSNPPSGCYFHPRCRYAQEVCKVETPVLRELSPAHFVSCHRAEELSLTGVV
jgi:oligopeptide/dipeptide ABC transporter ATP-binding protein